MQEYSHLFLNLFIANNFFRFMIYLKRVYTFSVIISKYSFSCHIYVHDTGTPNEELTEQMSCIVKK